MTSSAKGKSNYRSVAAQRRIEMLKNALADGPMSAWELAPKVFLSKRWVLSYLKRLHEQGIVHIESWRRNKGAHIAKYKLGCGVDADSPKPFTGAEYSDQYRTRLQQDLDAWDRYKAKRRARKIKPKRTADVAALFGDAA